jgi:hypothetical protein
MQKSSSFSDARLGKNRPNDLLAPRNAPSEAQPWRSPSFDVNSNTGVTMSAHVSADPGRPSTQARSIVRDSFPPTPLTATYKPLDLPTSSSIEKEQVRLPGIRDLLANSPPESQGMRTVPLPDQEYGQEHRYYSQAHSFSHDANAAALRSMPQSEQVQGLGLDLGETTPRLGDMEWSSMRTPTLSQQPRLPGAPQLGVAQSGRWPNAITSPIQPPLRRWNTDLRFDDRAPYVPYSRPPMAPRSVSEAGPSSVAMERERAIELEDGMPQGHKLWGLAMSMDNGETYRRGNYLFRPDGKIIGPTSMIRSVTGPQPMPAPINAAGPPTPARRSNDDATVQAGMPNSASKLVTSTGKSKSTGLTPHVYKTRLTPSFSTRSKNSGSPTSGVESPSLKMKSKQRSEQLRNQAANVAAQANLPSEHASVLGQVNAGQERSSPTHAGFTHTSTHSVPQSPLERTAHVYDNAAAPSPRKRSLELRRENAMAVDGVNKPASSPWGVFELGSQANTWQPLGPPALSNVLGKLNLDEACDDDEDEDAEFAKIHAGKAKRARKAPLGSGGNSQNASPAIGTITHRSTSPFVKQRGTSTPRSRHSSDSGTGEEKENDVFGSTMLGGNGRSSVSPNKQASSQGQRRLLSIR